VVPPAQALAGLRRGRPRGVAAAIGVFLYFDGALITQVRAKDKNLLPPMVVGLLAVAAGVLRIATR
jgi:hypothetical protein